MNMKRMMNLDLGMKTSLIRLVKEHKKDCEGEDCLISLFLLRCLAEKAGIKFTDKEKELFI